MKFHKVHRFKCLESEALVINAFQRTTENVLNMIILYLCFIQIVYSWGHTGIYIKVKQGHAVIARIAESFISDHTVSSIHDILGSTKISDIAVFKILLNNRVGLIKYECLDIFRGLRRFTIYRLETILPINVDLWKREIVLLVQIIKLKQRKMSSWSYNKLY